MSSGEFTMVRAALIWGLVATIPGAGIGAWLRGGKGAASVAVAALLVIGNSMLAAWIVTRAARKNDINAAAWALPSYAIRMVLMTLAMWGFIAMPFIDKTTFLATICIAVIVTLAIEARTYSKTPWAAITLMNDPKKLTEQGS